MPTFAQVCGFFPHEYVRAFSIRTSLFTYKCAYLGAPRGRVLSGLPPAAGVLPRVNCEVGTAAFICLSVLLEQGEVRGELGLRDLSFAGGSGGRAHAELGL